MSRALLIGTVLVLFGPAFASAQDTQPIKWPPAYMSQLPPDYLARLRASLDAGTNRLSKLKLDKTVSTESIGWVRYGMPALILGRRHAEINAFFESDTFVWSTNPKFGFSLFSVSYVRMYGLMNSRTGPLKGLLSAKAQANFERGMWKAARANSKLAEARRPVWHMEGSENHHLASKTCDLLVAQFLRNIPEYAEQKYDDGSTLAQQYETRNAYFLEWIDARAKRGQFVEAGSPSYQADSLSALFNLRDFAEDPLLRTKTEMYLDLAHAVIAEETLCTSRGGPKSRVKVGHEYDAGTERGYDVLFNAPGRTYVPLGTGAHATSNYYPPPVVVKLAQDTTQRGTYSFKTRWPGPLAEGGGRSDSDPDGQLWRTLDPERSVLRCGFATPDYVLGSAGLDPKWLDDAGMSSRWQGVIFASDPLARIGFEVLPADRQDWHHFNCFFSVQDRNILVTQKWAAVPPNPPSSLPSYLRIYFSPTLDELHEEDGWVFVRDGKAFAAVKVVGDAKWTQPWQHADGLTKDNKAFLTLESETAPVILIVNQAADYNGNFAAFQSAIKRQPVHFADGCLRFATIAFYGLARPSEINGQPVNLAPARGYDSPFVRSEWNSGLIYLRKGEDNAILDFRDPQHPVRTLNAPLTDAFPPGVGTERPITFDSPR